MESQILKAGKSRSVSFGRSEMELTGKESDPSEPEMVKLDMVRGRRETGEYGCRCRTVSHNLDLMDQLIE